MATKNLNINFNGELGELMAQLAEFPYSTQITAKIAQKKETILFSDEEFRAFVRDDEFIDFLNDEIPHCLADLGGSILRVFNVERDPLGRCISLVYRSHGDRTPHDFTFNL
jgi:hypothetical protein